MANRGAAAAGARAARPRKRRREADPGEEPEASRRCSAGRCRCGRPRTGSRRLGPTAACRSGPALLEVAQRVQQQRRGLVAGGDDGTSTRPAMRRRPEASASGGGARPLLLLPRELVSGVCHREQLMECPACGAALSPWRRAPDNEPASRATRLLLRCARVRDGADRGAAGRPTRTRRAPTPPARRAGAALAAPLLRAFDRQRLALLDGASGPLLDVGAGRGRFVAYARAHGFPDATGIEPSARSSAPHVAPVALEDAALRRARRDHAVARPRARRGSGGGAAAAARLAAAGRDAAGRRPRPRLAPGAHRRPALVPPRPAAPPHALHRPRPGHAAGALRLPGRGP